MFQRRHQGDAGTPFRLGVDGEGTAEVFHPLADTEKTETAFFPAVEVGLGGGKTDPVVFHDDPDMIVFTLGSDLDMFGFSVLDDIDQQFPDDLEQ